MQPTRINAWQKWSVLPLTVGIMGLSFAAGTFQNASPVAAQVTTQERMIQTLTVTGRSVERIPTILTQVQLGVEVQAKTAQEVQQEAAKRSAAVVEMLKKSNVERLETTGIRLNPIYSYANNTQRLTGYSATNTVSFRVATDRAGAIMDEAVNVGATRIDSISFAASDESISEAQKTALRKATQDAQAQADAVLNSLNLTRKGIVSIQINNASAPPPPPIMLERANFAGKADAVPTPVIGGDQEVRAEVTLQIRY